MQSSADSIRKESTYPDSPPHLSSLVSNFLKWPFIRNSYSACVKNEWKYLIKFVES